MTVEFLEPAWLEFREAAQYYEGTQAGLGEEFRLEVVHTLERIREFPEAFPTIDAEIRKCVLPKFPYCLMFVANEHELLVVAVAHSRRKPMYWKARLNQG